MKTGTPFAERTRWRGASCAPVPYRCAPLPRWGRSGVRGLALNTARPAGTGTLRPGRPPSLPLSQAGGNGRLGRGRASADSSGPFTQACGPGARGLGEPRLRAERKERRQWLLQVWGAPPGSPCTARPRSLRLCDRGASMSQRLSAGGSGLPRGVPARGSQRGSGNICSVGPFQSFSLAASPLKSAFFPAALGGRIN